jgi:hypothetical protein
MDEWAEHPRAETALSNILPCVDESTTNRTLYQSKYVVVQLVTLVNKAISALSNRKPYHLHPGQLMPYLCSPYDSKLNDRQCLSREVTFDNATTVSIVILVLLIKTFANIPKFKSFHNLSFLFTSILCGCTGSASGSLIGYPLPSLVK